MSDWINPILKIRLLKMGARPLISFSKNNPSVEIEEESEKQEEKQEEKSAEPIEAVESFKKEYASKLGWTTKETWEAAGKNPDNWRDYEHFLNTSPAYMEKLRKTNREYSQRIERNAAAAAAAIEEDRRVSREQAKQEAREAAKAGDEERAAAAVDRAAEAGPPPETTAWMKKNPWFNDDQEAQAVAIAAVNRSAKAGATIAEQLQAAEASVKKRFPEYFEEEIEELPEFVKREPVKEEPKKEVKMSESSKVAAANDAPASARNRETSSKREKGFADIPKGDQDLYEKFFARKFVSHGLTVDAARDKYAKTYWKNQG